MKIDIRTDEAKAKDILKEQRVRKALEKEAAKKWEDRPHVYNTNYNPPNWRRTVAENGSVVFTQRRPLGQPLYEIGQEYRVDHPVSDIIAGSILIVAGVDETSQTLTMLYHLTNNPSRSITISMETADRCLTFNPNHRVDTDRGETFCEMTRPEWAGIIGVCFVTGFVVAVISTAIGSWLF